MEAGFCGSGLMGAPVIRRVLQAGHRVQVWNRTPDKAAALVADGAQVVATPAALFAAVDVVLLCLADAQAVEEVVFGPAGVLSPAAVAGWPAVAGHACVTESATESAVADAPAARPRVRWIVDHSSIAPRATAALAQRAAAFGVGWIDAPVSGGVAGAAAGTLAVMAGGAAADLEQVLPLLRTYAARVTLMGPAGAGQTAKLCNQAIVTATLAAIAEAISLAQRSGLDAARLGEALAGGWADSVLLQTFVPRMTHPGSAPQPAIGALKVFQKDVDAFATAAGETGTPVPVASTVQQLLRLGGALGLAQADLSGFIDILQMRQPSAEGGRPDNGKNGI
ncbi:NAD(P)-dependent oxidoreductase [Paraburkholderia bonniea]|uniref:NAD(P)-dependent oxidoreductase n=1 Tax=Paraburkholderia bonniea TaxID=2152891 RepID=UPI001291CAD9|nr:NAD(P)-dependent oxidoreductase [Paraburkholderia bonniea]WJF89138.1 NAD(P)-dependent oxidoreductase [Paraburkholderia bonniea]WJF92454.1 NAD(P)-dependent oxidoreductase [Paraburkholderia bonniea]